MSQKVEIENRIEICELMIQLLDLVKQRTNDQYTVTEADEISIHLQRRIRLHRRIPTMRGMVFPNLNTDYAREAGCPYPASWPRGAVMIES